MVKGLGETLVGAYPGRALSFVCKKDDLNSPKVNLEHSYLPHVCSHSEFLLDVSIPPLYILIFLSSV